jgi:hypothetical protein
VVTQTSVVLTATNGVNGTFDSVVALPPTESSCSQVTANPPVNSGTTLSVTLNVDDANCNVAEQTGLTGGAIAGIVIGSIVLVGIIVVAVVGILIRKRRTQNQLSTIRGKINRSYQDEKSLNEAL